MPPAEQKTEGIMMQLGGRDKQRIGRWKKIWNLLLEELLVHEVSGSADNGNACTNDNFLNGLENFLHFELSPFLDNI